MSTIDFEGVLRQTASGIPYKLIAGPTGSEDEEKASASETYVLRASDLDSFIEESFPTPVQIAGFLVIDLRRPMPGRPFLLTKTVAFGPLDQSKPIDPFGAHSNAPAGTYGSLVKVDIGYETSLENDDNKPNENEPVTFLERSKNVGIEQLAVPPVKTEIAEGESPSTGDFTENKDPTLPWFKLIPTVEHTLKWKWALRPNWTNIYAAMGKVNDKAYKYFDNAKAEHVLFAGVTGQQNYKFFRARRKIAVVIDPWSLEFKFVQRTINDNGEQYGWNHVYSADKGKWVKIRRKDLNLFLYETTNFDDIFKADTSST